MADLNINDAHQNEITDAVNKLTKRQSEKGELIELHVERLIFAGIQKGLITPDDIFVVRNGLMSFFGLEKPYAGRINKSERRSLPDILRKITEIAASKGLCRPSEAARDDYASKIMGFLTPRNSEIVSRFQTLSKESPELATDWFFKLSKDVDYIKTAKMNLSWIAETEYGFLDITINVSKPEKDPKDIEAAKNAPYRTYPKCLLCPQCAGFGGNGADFPSRDNHRIIPLKLNGKKWYFQYSPYQYYNEHCIVLYENHVPMAISEKTFNALFDFIEQFPHYFIGSNADLPIVGGSILSHEHYQGGKQVFAIESAPVLKSLKSGIFDGIDADIIKWPLSTIRLKGTDRNSLIAAGVRISNVWKEYSDSIIAAFTTDNERRSKAQHNTVTPILRKKHGGFELDIVLRNNLTSAEFPLGIYHPHEDVWHIKKENIGLIEVMGLAVLPARLIAECSKIRKLLGLELPARSTRNENRFQNGEEGGEKLYLTNKGRYFSENPELTKHSEWIDFLISIYGMKNDDDAAREILEKEIGIKFARVLSDCGVFSVDNDGLERFCAFMAAAGFQLP